MFLRASLVFLVSSLCMESTSTKTLIPPSISPESISQTVPSITNRNIINPQSVSLEVTHRHIEPTSPIDTLDSTQASMPLEPGANTEQLEDAISFGIRSFTVEVTTNEKSSLPTTFPIDSKQTFNSEFASSSEPEDSTQSTTTRTSSPMAEKASTREDFDGKASSNLDFPTKSSGSKWEIALQDKMSKNVEPHHENDIFNDIRPEETPKAGLYRVQLGEITTDEFNSNLNVNEPEQEGESRPVDVPVHHEEPKVNIDDFFPSKSEDFSSITGASKGKSLNDKIEVHDEQIRLGSSTDSSRIGSTNMTTTNIEIELIEDTLNAKNKQKTGDSEGAVEVKQFFAENSTQSMANNQTTDNLKRTKKFDPSMKSNTQGPQRIHDFGMTKFKQAKSTKGESQPVSGNPEFSTTKFYNSKEAQANLLLKKTSKSSVKSETPRQVQQLEASKLAISRGSSTSNPRALSRLEEKMNSLDCDIQNLSADSTVWRGNETHELMLPALTPEDCSSGTDCLPMIISWEASADIQSGDVLIVEIDDKLLVTREKKKSTSDKIIHHEAAVYQVTRLGHERCDITEGELLDITPLIVDDKKLVTLYDKDLTEGINLLIVVSELWDQQCVRLRVNVKSDNCGENAECSGKGICFSNASMEGYECECCFGFTGSHCEEIDACTPSPCTNNGICVDLSQGHEGNSYQCLCPYGYTGKLCQAEADPCNPSQCLNGGACITNSTHFRCECSQGFTGPICQHNLNECESSPCVHGICVDQEDGFRCFCQPGFSGDLCNFEYNECDSNPCINNAQCIDHIGGFSCQCTKGYQGKRCHIKIDFCANNPCEDGYRCIDHGDEYSCVCPGSGDHNVPDCHEVPRTLCSTNPCSNGGTCWTSDESFYCACRPGFTGKLCEDDFVVDTVVSSSELLSDVSDANVITFEESREVKQGSGLFNFHKTSIAAGMILVILLAVVVFVNVAKLNGCYRRIIKSYNNFMKRNKITKLNGHNKHWLSGKNSSFFEENHINLKNNQPPREIRSSRCLPPNRPPQMNNESDMYYSVDFGDSQQSLLIQ